MLNDPFSAAVAYGMRPAAQPTNSPAPPPPAAGERSMRTEPRDSDDGRGDPIAWFVLLIGAAIAFGYLSAAISGGVSVGRRT